MRAWVAPSGRPQLRTLATLRVRADANGRVEHRCSTPVEARADRSASHANVTDPHCERVAEPREASRSGLHQWVVPSGRPRNDSSRAMRAAIRGERQCRASMLDIDWSGGRSVCPLIVVTRLHCAAPDGASANCGGVLRHQGAPPSSLRDYLGAFATCGYLSVPLLGTTYHDLPCLSLAEDAGSP